MNAAEKKIADFLDEVGIKYVYENPQIIEQEFDNRDGTKKKFLRIYYPDFLLSEFGILLEFWGMHEDKEYSRVMEKKKQDYYYNWIFVVNVYNLDGNWKEYILKKIKDVSEHRLRVIGRAKEKFDVWPDEKKIGDGGKWRQKREEQKSTRVASPVKEPEKPKPSTVQKTVQKSAPRIESPRTGQTSKTARPKVSVTSSRGKPASKTKNVPSSKTKNVPSSRQSETSKKGSSKSSSSSSSKTKSTSPAKHIAPVKSKVEKNEEPKEKKSLLGRLFKKD